MIVDDAIVGAFGLWFVASAVAQIRSPLATWLRDRDAFGLLPSWSFFAPNPARTDCHVLYRHGLDDGSVTRWTEVFVWRAPWHRFIWNPDRRMEKAISDLSVALQRNPSSKGVRFSIPYLLLLDHVSRLPRPHSATRVQFTVMGSSGSGKEWMSFVRFVSDAHPLDGSAPKARIAV